MVQLQHADTVAKAATAVAACQAGHDQAAHGHQARVRFAIIIAGAIEGAAAQLSTAGSCPAAVLTC